MITKATLLQIFDAADLLTCDGVKVVGIETGNLVVPDSHLISLWDGRDVVAGTVDQEISVTDGEFKLKDSRGFDVLFETYMLFKSSDLGIVQS